MDDTTRIAMAYAGLVLGLPLLAAKFLWLLPGSVLQRIFRHKAQSLCQLTAGLAEGFLTLLLTSLIFDRLAIPVDQTVPVILIAICFIVNRITQENSDAWPSVIGILAGFALYPKVLTILPIDWLSIM